MSGIYQIRNLINNKVYIGSAKNMAQRKQHHFNMLKLNQHDNIHLQRAYNKDGEDNFIWEILEQVDIDLLIEKEQYYIDQLLDGMKYNIRKIAESNLGIKFSEESKQKMSEQRKGRLFVTPKDILKRSREYPSFVDPEGNVYPQGCNLAKFCREHNLSSTHMRGILNRGQKSHKGWMTLENYLEPPEIKIPKTPKPKKKYPRNYVRKGFACMDIPDLLGPDDTIYTGAQNLAEFCRIHELAENKMRDVISGRRKQHKGWRLVSY